MVECLRPARLAAIAGLLLLVATAATSSAAEPLAFPIHEPPFTATLANIDSEWNIHLRTTDDKVRVVAADDLAYWGRYHEVEAGPQILLTDGSVIRADVLALDDQQLVLGDATGLGRGQWDESTLPRAAVRAILYQPPADAAVRDTLRTMFNDHPLHESVLLLQDGESIASTLVAVPKSGRFAPEGAKPGSEAFSIARAGALELLTIPASKVVAFRSYTAISNRPVAGAVWLGFADGSLVNTRLLAVKGDEVTITLACGGVLQTTLAGRNNPDDKLWDAIQYIQPAAARLQWLSQQKPLGYKHIPFLSVEWPLGADQNVLGSRLRAGGATFLQGLGMPSTSRVAYDVASYRKFEAEIALDDAAGLQGSVKFKVLLQGAASNDRAATTGNEWSPAYESPVIRGGDPPMPISLDLNGAARMALIVEFADRGDERDWADWLNARVTK